MRISFLSFLCLLMLLIIVVPVAIAIFVSISNKQKIVNEKNKRELIKKAILESNPFKEIPEPVISDIPQDYMKVFNENDPTYKRLQILTYLLNKRAIEHNINRNYEIKNAYIYDTSNELYSTIFTTIYDRKPQSFRQLNFNQQKLLLSVAKDNFNETVEKLIEEAFR